MTKFTNAEIEVSSTLSMPTQKISIEQLEKDEFSFWIWAASVGVNFPIDRGSLLRLGRMIVKAAKTEPK